MLFPLPEQRSSFRLRLFTRILSFLSAFSALPGQEALCSVPENLGMNRLDYAIEDSVRSAEKRAAVKIK